MKLHLTNLVLTAGLSALLGSLALSAQDRKAIANIPFAYHVGQKSLTAGTYTIQKMDALGTFRLLDDQSGHSMFVSVTPLDTGGKNDPKLTFSCYAGQCSLSELWMAGNGYRLTARPPVRVANNQMGVVALISLPLLSR
jgi:hypothetical protein